MMCIVNYMVNACQGWRVPVRGEVPVIVTRTTDWGAAAGIYQEKPRQETGVRFHSRRASKIVSCLLSPPLLLDAAGRQESQPNLAAIRAAVYAAAGIYQEKPRQETGVDLEALRE